MRKPVFEVPRISGIFGALEDWEAFAAKIRERADEYDEATFWLQRAQKEIDRLRGMGSVRLEDHRARPA
jgi:hypothetical protein